MIWTAVSMGVQCPLPFDQALDACKLALAQKGFGVVSEVDMQANFQDRLGIETEPLTTLGACHAETASELLSAHPSLSVLLPCNVTISVEDGRTFVRTIDPRTILGAVENEGIRPTVEWLRESLFDVLQIMRSVSPASV